VNDELEPTPLRADARRMLATWRDADQMPRASKVRVWRRLRGERKQRPAALQRSTAWVWVVALAAAVLLVWWGSASVLRSARDEAVHDADQAVDDRVPDGSRPAAEAAPRAAAPVIEPPVEAAPSPAPVQTPKIAEEPQRSETHARPRAVSPPRGDDAPASTPSSAPTTTLARERDVIARAWSALADGDPGSALQRAAEHELAFPDGLLAPERRAIAVIARCRRGDQGAAARAQSWLDAQPRSPLAGRVRAACISASP
jgi:hypothetical protein